ncbi:30S ribosomal protein S17 [Candidatus Amesbacteria bacterium RIFCSPHIGHO2_01_FULL_48_32]|uniref:Small ribosomal subunit protein uS17 n=1 Tax=Candidatus Amesbacteria bacterium RIFCSPLOWO2_01_FULL_48_25 TaxID=1797259 RepID=A0A1F4ZBR8_9BACT|nr:MAG: 30S ribosomal protein S17 [Candidatus Amesbacteria bacterium RIFCSPHIGHO2_01_FULL_48_32]OGD03317.1 MAG: 30S ribosomal protein S17 [Candidatus Amesbacteria bacterium RIFCSPLOWO2_01_FULL_48_25]HJZ05265.1 30S ribosomal protein S17 [Patescibacteria group bacterium]
MKTLSGLVVSDKMQNTVVVAVAKWMKHPKYDKRTKKTRKYHARNETGAKVGDTVTIVEVKPVAKTVFFKVVGVESGGKK